MCVIAICQAALPKRAQLRTAARVNSDGIGLAWIANGRVHWHKGLDDPDEVLHIARSKPLPVVLHCRMASAGEACPELTHPFPLEPGVPLDLYGSTDAGVLCHNGHWHQWREVSLSLLMTRGIRPLTGPVSDTRYMALLLYHLGHDVAPLLGDHKLAILTPSGVITHGSGWHTSGGVAWSNYSYEEPMCGTKFGTIGKRWLTP